MLQTVIERDTHSESPAMSAARDARLPRWLEVLGVLVILLELVAPFVSTSFGTDGPSQAYLADAFSKLLLRGVLFPTWLPDGFNGHGSPSFYFYPPLAFYLAGLVRLVTRISSPEGLFHAVGLIATVGSFLSARVLLRQFSASRYQLLIGSLIYAFGPYRIAELYSRSSLSSHVAYAILPLVWYGLLKVVQHDRSSSRRNTLVLGVSSAALLLTSVPLTLLTGVSAAVIAIVWRAHLRSVELWKQLVLAAMLAIGLSAFHFVRVIEYGGYVHLNELTRAPMFLIVDIFHLQSLSIAYHAAILYGCIAILGWVYWKHAARLATRERAVVLTLLGLTPLLVFLETPYISLPVWLHVTFISLIQVVWRFYIEVLLLVACAVAAASTRSMQRAATFMTGLLVIGALLPAVLAATNYHIGTHFTPATGDPVEYVPARVTDSATIVTRQPITVEPALQTSEFVRVGRPDPVDYQIESQLEVPHSVHVPRFAWPAWHARENRTTVPIVADANGLSQLDIPAGVHEIRVELKRCAMENIGMWISGIALLFAGVLFAIDVFHSKSLVVRTNLYA